MKKKLYIIIFLFAIVCHAPAQVNYTFSATSATYSSINGTIVPLEDLTGYGATEEGHKNDLPIGFAFNYNGTAYSTIGVSANGFAFFGAINDVDAANAAYINGLKDLMLTCRPILAPFWEDTKYGSSDKISYLASGTAPNRIFTLQWTDMIIGWDYSSPTPTPSLNMQLKLYETTNVIEFAYSQIPGGLVGSVGSDASGGASIGLSALATGTNNFLSLSNSGTSPSASSATESSTIALRPATDQLYRFIPTFTTPVTFANFKAVKNNTAINLTWTTFTEINNKGFEIEKSLDAKKFENIGFAPTLANNGSSSNTINYSFNDFYLRKTNSYYRFKQIDLDGKFVYGPVVLVKAINATSIQLGAVYPNPAKNILSVILQTPVAQAAHLSLTDMAGKIINQRTTRLTVGDNFIPLDISRLSPGVYLIKVTTADSAQLDCIKFIKQ